MLCSLLLVLLCPLCWAVESSIRLPSVPTKEIKQFFQASSKSIHLFDDLQFHPILGDKDGLLYVAYDTIPFEDIRDIQYVSMRVDSRDHSEANIHQHPPHFYQGIYFRSIRELYLLETPSLEYNLYLEIKKSEEQPHEVEEENQFRQFVVKSPKKKDESFQFINESSSGLFYRFNPVTKQTMQLFVSRQDEIDELFTNRTGLKKKDDVLLLSLDTPSYCIYCPLSQPLRHDDEKKNISALSISATGPFLFSSPDIRLVMLRSFPTQLKAEYTLEMKVIIIFFISISS